MTESTTRSGSTKSLSIGVQDTPLIHARWNWRAKLGVALIFLGILAMATELTSGNSVLLLSWLIVVSGLVEVVHAFHLRRSEEFFFHLVPAIAGIPLGLLMVTHPAADATTWMFVFASFFTVVGVFRLISAVRLKFPAWRWAVLDSMATLLLGCLFWTAWIWLTPWIFGVGVGTSLLLRGWSSIMFGLALQRPRPAIRTHPPSSEGTIQTQLHSSRVT